MTTNELIERGIGHNCLSDAYDLGRQDALKEIAYSDNVIKEPFEILAYNKGSAEGIYKACEILYQYIDWYDCPIKCVGGCGNRDCSKDLAEYVLEQLKERQNDNK